MGKGKGKSSGTGRRGGTRKIAKVRVHTSKSKPTKPIPVAPVAAAAAVARTAGAAGEPKGAGAGAAGINKKSKKARPCDTAQAPGPGSAAKALPTQQPVASNGEMFKMTCTCLHLAHHPRRADLKRKLVDVRTKANTCRIMKERTTVGVFGALDGEGMGELGSQCRDCEEHTLDELDNVLTCLECGYTGCGSPPHRHFLRHCITQPGENHCFAVCRARAEIFCARCCDYVYDVEFDATVSRADDDFELPAFRDGGFGGDEWVRGKRRRRASRDGYYVVTDRFGQQPGRERSWPPPVLLSPARGRLVAAGVRGMFNLGNTCFMSSVLQAVLHISVMQSFFSGKGHEPTKCEKLRKETNRLRSQILQYDSKASFDSSWSPQEEEGGGGGGKGAVPENGGKVRAAKKLGDYCIACELARLFEDMFSAEAAAATLDDTEPYVPNRLLEAVWSASEFLAGYEQQDAHEFLMAVLDNLHGHLDRAAKNESSAPGLRRTLAAHKLRAKQQQSPQQQQQKQQSPQQQQQQQLKQTQIDKEAVSSSLGAAPGSAAGGRDGDNSNSNKTNRYKRGREPDETGSLVGWESPAVFENDDKNAVARAAAAAAVAAAVATGRIGERSKSERAALSPLVQPGKGTAQDYHGESPPPPRARPAMWQANGGSAGSPICPPTPQGAETERKTNPEAASPSPTARPGSTTSERGEEAQESDGARLGGGGAQSVEKRAETKGVLNGQRLEDVNLAGFVQEVFAGVTRSDVVCTSCKHVSCTYERFLEVSLPVRPGEHEKRQNQHRDKSKVSPDRVAKNSRPRDVGVGTGRRNAVKHEFPGIPSVSLDTAQHNGGHKSSVLPVKVEASGEGRFISATNGSRRELPPSSSATAPAPGTQPRQPRPPTGSHRKSPSKKADSVRKRSPEACRDARSGGASQARASFGGASLPSNPSNVNAREVVSDLESSSPSGGQARGVTKRSLGGVGRRDSGANRGADPAAPLPRTISDCFARFAAREDLTARMTCDSCSASSVWKTKQMSFCSLPRVLVLHLKRFDAMADRKIDDFVSFPARGLDMGRYLTGWPASLPRNPRDTLEPTALPQQPTCGSGSTATGADQPDAETLRPNEADADRAAAVPPPSLLYDLMAVVNHSGSMAQGHYTAFVKEAGKWFRFDDTWVSEVSEQEVLASEAYILFYFQRGADATWKPKPAATPPSSPSDAAAPSSPSWSNGDHAPPGDVAVAGKERL